MVFRQFHYTKRDRFMPFLLAEILNFQGSTHRIGVGSFSNFILYPGQTDLQSPASKADSEQNYYVRQTQTVVSQGESPRTRYYSCYGGKIVSKPLNLSCNDFNRHFEAYTTTAKSGRTYELYGGYVSGTGAEFSHITGVWTP